MNEHEKAISDILTRLDDTITPGQQRELDALHVQIFEALRFMQVTFNEAVRQCITALQKHASEPTPTNYARGRREGFRAAAEVLEVVVSGPKAH